MNDIAIHDFNKIACIIGGVPITDYFEGDDVIRINRNQQSISTIIGADGSAIASIQTDESAVVELKLKPSSAGNALLEGLDRLFRRSLTASPFPMIITDFANGTVWTSSQSVVATQPPEISLGTNATVRTWSIFVGRLTDTSIGTLV